MVILLIMIGSGVRAAWRYRTAVRTPLSMLRCLKRDQHFGTKRTPATLTSPRISCVDLFASAGATVTGPGAEDAVRSFAVDALVGRRDDGIELVLTRSDAWHLFGIDNETLRDERIPGLTLTDDHQQTHAYLVRRGLVRRILITCDGDAEDVRKIRAYKQDLAVISLSGWTEDAMEIAANGEVIPESTASVPSNLPLLPRHDALDQLTSMPTTARHPSRRGIRGA
ncbi:hypothetical protein [Actinomadura welshii]|uniref:hypothetical protein n=1 Tax=Actinomadura welshii TaxID=3103817 RepID=UPI0003AD1C2C|nr:hypothetical protein [Actinomadura madurae]